MPHFLHFIRAFGLSVLAARAQQISLGTASGYGVVAATTITNTGLTVINAPIALSSGSSITGFPPGINTGEDIDDAAAVQAEADIHTAFAALAALPATTDLTGINLGGLTLTPGVYKFSSSGELTGILTLDAQGNPNAVFVFQFGSTLVTATAASVVLINGAQPCNVYWQVGSSATLGRATVFAGNVLAQASITVTTGASLAGGGFFALTAAVTLDTNAIDPLGACGASIIAPLTSTTATTSTAASTVAPATTTTTITSTVTDPASTTVVTVTQQATVTITQTVATTTSTCTSTSTKWSTKSASATATATACPKSGKRAADLVARKNNVKTKTVVTTCAGHTSTHVQKAPQTTSTTKKTYTSTSTVWHSTSATTTYTSTKTPACTTKAKRDYQRLFE